MVFNLWPIGQIQPKGPVIQPVGRSTEIWQQVGMLIAMNWHVQPGQCIGSGCGLDSVYGAGSACQIAPVDRPHAQTPGLIQPTCWPVPLIWGWKVEHNV